ncbi:MAG: BMC domain-containing protein [Polyangia bacterium]|jgi:microcompartment protein CcmL/EutN|nr:BMC domain-containing protein [Polyangia bacterium]
MSLIPSIDCTGGEWQGGQVAPEAIGGLETRSIALGMEAADAMLKAAEVELLMASPACPGKYLILVTGTVAAVRASVEAGRPVAADAFVDDLVLPSVHPQVIPALSAMTRLEEVAALGVLETFSMTGALRAADQAVKAADVRLVEIRLGRGLGGKAFVLLTGEVAAVRAATQAALLAIQDQALVLGVTVIPSPHPGLVDKLL